jgi:hypothetical protein
MRYENKAVGSFEDSAQNCAVTQRGDGRAKQRGPKPLDQNRR